jgi:hypothetical protein
MAYDVERGTTPEKVAEAIDKAQRERSRDKPPTSTADRERFFAGLAELRKQAESG